MAQAVGYSEQEAAENDGVDPWKAARQVCITRSYDHPVISIVVDS